MGVPASLLLRAITVFVAITTGSCQATLSLPPGVPPGIPASSSQPAIPGGSSGPPPTPTSTGPQGPVVVVSPVSPAAGTGTLVPSSPVSPSPSPISSTLPPGPPLDWKTLPIDTKTIYGIRLEGPFILPWTKSKAFIFNTVLANRYLRSVDINDISNGVVQSYQFNQAPSVPALPSPSPSPSPSPPPPQTTNHSSPGAGRKLLYNGIRKLSQTPWTSTLITGVILRVQVLTNAMRVQSEVTTLVNAIDSGMLASDLQLALGMEITNISFTQQPVSSPYNMVTTSSPAGSLPTWAIGVIVGVILILLPIPLYILYRRRRKSHISALEKQQAEAAAARQRMQSRILKTGGKMFSKGRSPYGSAYNVGAAQGLPGDAILLEQAKSSMPGGSPSSRVTESLSSDGDSCRDSISSNASFRMERYSQSMADGVANMEANRALYYQQQSIGRTMPHRSPPGGLSRPPGSNVDVSARYQHPGRVNVRYGSTYPLRYPTEEASTSSGNLSDRR